MSQACIPDLRSTADPGFYLAVFVVPVRVVMFGMYDFECQGLIVFSNWPNKQRLKLSLELVWGTFGSLWNASPDWTKKAMVKYRYSTTLQFVPSTLGASTFTCCSLAPYRRIPCLKLMPSHPKRKLSCLPNINNQTSMHMCYCWWFGTSANQFTLKTLPSPLATSFT